MFLPIDCGLDGLTFHLPSLVQPQFAADCDLSGIVKRFLRTGQLPDTVNRPTIDDALDMPDDFGDLMERTRSVQQRFDLLPLAVRNEFNNDPELWLASLETPKEPPLKPTDPLSKPAEPPKPAE